MPLRESIRQLAQTLAEEADPNRRIRVEEILNAVAQYYHDHCRLHRNWRSDTLDPIGCDKADVLSVAVMKRIIIIALLVAGCSDLSYPRLEGARNTYTATQVWAAERDGPVTYCWSETASAPRTCIYTQAQCVEVSRQQGRGFCQPAGWSR